MAFTLNGTFSFRGVCPRHKRYDPIKQGQGGIKGGCPKCAALYSAWSGWIEFMRKRNYADEIVNNPKG